MDGAGDPELRRRPRHARPARQRSAVVVVAVAVVVLALVAVAGLHLLTNGTGGSRTGAVPASAAGRTGPATAVPLVDTGSPTAPVRARPPLPSASPGADPSAAGPSAEPAPTSAAADLVLQQTAAVRAVLALRSAALLHRDLTGFAATLDPTATAYRKAQLAVYANTAAVPFASWFYDVDPADVAAATSPRPGELLVGVTLRYALRGFDPQPTALRQWLTFRTAPAGWLLAGDTDGAAAGDRTARDLWDFGPVIVVRGVSSLVLAHPAGAGLAQLLAGTADAAVPRVTAFWGDGWARKVVILVPASQQELSSIVGTTQDLSQIAALATAELGEAGTSGSSGAVGDRVAINPATFGTLGSLGRRVVLTHEITHVATRSVTGDSMPTWLVEGIADYVGFKGTSTSLRFDAAELAHQVDAGHLPSALPTSADFAAAGASLSLDYEEAWLACKFIVSRTSEATLIAFYRQVGTAQGQPADVLRAAFAQVLHTDQATFTASWASYVGASLK